MRKSSVAAAVIAATVTATVAVVPTTAQADWSDVYFVKQATIQSFRQMTYRDQRVLCQVWRNTPSITYRSLVPVAVEHGVTRYDARTGIRLGMNKLCPTYYPSHHNTY
jgi:hypothetical protein